MATPQKITDAQFDEAYLIIAKLVAETGDEYLLIFKRMHEEKKLREANQELKAIALLAAGKVPS